MATKSRGSLSLKAAFTEVGDSIWGGPVLGGAMSAALNFTNGVLANQFDLIYAAERTVAASTNDDIDLKGSLLTLLGAPMTPNEIAAVVIVNAPKSGPANTTSLTIGGATAGVPGFETVGVTIGPGGFFAASAPGVAGLASVTPTTGDIIRVTNGSGASAKYQIVVFGRSS